MIKQGNFFYNIVRDDEEVFIYIPLKEGVSVKYIEIKSSNIILNYDENKTYTIRDIKTVLLKKIMSAKSIWIVEINKEKEIKSAYKIRIK